LILHISDETLQEEQLPFHLNSDEKCINSNEVCAQVPHIVSTRSSPIEVPTPSSSTLVLDNTSTLSMLQFTSDQSLTPTDPFSIKNFQSFATTVEDQNKDNSNSNTITFETENESEYSIKDECSKRTRKEQRFTISTHPAEKRTLESTKKDLLKAFQKKHETNNE